MKKSWRGENASGSSLRTLLDDDDDVNNDDDDDGGGDGDDNDDDERWRCFHFLFSLSLSRSRVSAAYCGRFVSLSGPPSENCAVDVFSHFFLFIFGFFFTGPGSVKQPIILQNIPPP